MDRTIYPTVTTAMWHPVPELKQRWLKQYGKERFSFEEARQLQTFPDWWLFPKTKKVSGCFLRQKKLNGSG